MIVQLSIFHYFTITTKIVIFTTKSVKITTKCPIFTTKPAIFTTKSQTREIPSRLTVFLGHDESKITVSPLNHEKKELSEPLT